MKSNIMDIEVQFQHQTDAALQPHTGGRHMTNREALIALRDAVVAGKWGPETQALRSPPATFKTPFAPEPMDKRRRQAWSAYHGSVDAAIALLEAVLLGWGWRIASCHLSDDAFVFPDYNCPVHGARLRDTVPTLVDGVEWSEFTDVDLRPSGNPARALLIATLNALIAEDA